MATLLGKIVADFRTTLATEIAVGGTSATLQSATDSDGNAIPSGTYYFTLDKEGSQKEHIVCSVSGTAVTSISTVTRQGVVTSGVVRKHRIGASVEITDFTHISRMNDLLAGTTDLNASDPLKYDGVATLTPGSNELCTVVYADGLTFAGAPNGSTTQKGLFEGSTVAEQGTATSVGGTGAFLVPLNGNLVKTSSGSGDENKIAVLGANGVFADGFLDAARTWGTVQSFTANNCQITTDADSANDPVRSSYLDAQLLANIPLGAIVGTSGEAITKGQGVYIKASDGKLYKTVGSADESTFSFIGVALTTVAAADLSVSYAPPGHTVTGLSGLTAGSFYFITDTAGTLGTTPGTRFARVAIAVSTTALQVITPKYRVVGTITMSAVSNGSTTATSVPFYPGKLSFKFSGVTGVDQSGPGVGWGFSDDAGILSLAGNVSFTDRSSNAVGYVYATRSSTEAWTGAITARTNTSFTITNTRTSGTGTLTLYMQYIAESL